MGMREQFEELELELLAPYALRSKFSTGKQYQEPLCHNRTCFQRDRDRIIHSKAFRRLKHKTQVFIANESDHYRSRLTHSLEVAQISRHLARLLKLNEDVAEAISLAHDLGHTPFGHSGEDELNRLMTDHGGFEHNHQSKRIIDLLEYKYPDFPGLNLSFEIREGLIKHSTPWDNPKAQKKTFVSLEAQIANVADEIAYNNHDLDDGLTSTILDESQLNQKITLWKEAKKKIKKGYTNLEKHQLITLINSHLISSQVKDIFETSHRTIQQSNIGSLEDLQTCPDILIRFSDDMMEKNKELRRYLYDQFYSHPVIYKMNKKGQYIIRKLFKAFCDDPKLLPKHHKEKITDPHRPYRIACDYIAGMTDTFAIKEYNSIY